MLIPNTPLIVWVILSKGSTSAWVKESALKEMLWSIGKKPTNRNPCDGIRTNFARSAHFHVFLAKFWFTGVKLCVEFKMFLLHPTISFWALKRVFSILVDF